MSDLQIITCPEWHARQPRGHISTVGRAQRIIFHHTAGHLKQIDRPSGESLEEAIRYAQDIQHAHMDVNGWVDSGHNFLVTRGGHVLQGRWLTVAAIEAGHMVLSAHCPTQNTQIGIEHEHQGKEKMTAAQREAAAQLQAWIAWQYGRTQPLPVDPHRRYFATACPANLVADIPKIRARAGQIISGWL